MRNSRKVVLNNIILISIIVILCVSVPIGYIYIDNIIFNKTLVKTPEKEYNPLPQTSVRLHSTGSDINLDFSHLAAPTNDYSNILFVYKDSTGDDFYLDSKDNSLEAVSFVVSDSDRTSAGKLSDKDLKDKAEAFMKDIADLTKYTYDGIYSDNDAYVLSWSVHDEEVATCDSIAVTMYRNGIIKSLALNNNGFYDENLADMPVIINGGYSEEASAEKRGAETLINTVNTSKGAGITKYTKEYSKLMVDTDFQLYWEFIMQLDVPQQDIMNGVKSYYLVKVNAVSNGVIFKEIK